MTIDTSKDLPLYEETLFELRRTTVEQIRYLLDRLELIDEKIRMGKVYLNEKEAIEYLHLSLEKLPPEIPYSKISIRDKIFRITDLDAFYNRHIKKKGD